MPTTDHLTEAPRTNPERTRAGDPPDVGAVGNPVRPIRTL